MAEICFSRAHSRFLPPTDRALFGDTVAALRKDVELAVLRQQLDLDTGPRLLPRFVDQMLLQTGQATLRRADQVTDRGVGRAHFGQHLLGRHTAVHQPDPACFAVLPLDAFEKAAQRGLV
jgi:hypothetical protein